MDSGELQSQLQALLGPFLSQLRPSQTPIQPTEPAGPLIAPSRPLTASLALESSSNNIHQPFVQPQQIQPAITSQASRPQSASILPSIPAYQSSRLAGVAPPTRPLPSSVGMGYPSIQRSNSSATFLGFENTSQANQRRLASASASLPRRPALAARTARATSVPSSGMVIRGRRPRGRAGRPPSLPSATTVSDVTFHNVSADAYFLRIRCKVYPPLGVS